MPKTNATTPRSTWSGSHTGGKRTKGEETRNEEGAANLDLMKQRMPKRMPKSPMTKPPTKPTSKRVLKTIDPNGSAKSGGESKPSPPAKKAKSSPLAPAAAKALHQTTLSLSSTMAAALKAVDSKISNEDHALTPIQKMKLVFTEWLRQKLFEGEAGRMRAMNSYLAQEQDNLLKDLRNGGRLMWKLIFLAEYPHYHGVRLLTDKTEEYVDNGFEFKERGGFSATAKLLGVPSALSMKHSLQRFGYEQHWDWHYSSGTQGGKVVMYHKHCHKSADLYLFKYDDNCWLPKRPRPSPLTSTTTDFILPAPFTQKKGDPTEDEVNVVLSHMLTLSGVELSTLFASVNIRMLEKLANYVGMTSAWNKSKTLIHTWLVENTNTWHKVVREKIAEAEVDIGDLKEFTTRPLQPIKKTDYTEQELRTISSLLTSMGKTKEGRVQIEVYMNKVSGIRLKGIMNHNSIKLKKTSRTFMMSVIMKHFVSS